MTRRLALAGALCCATIALASTALAARGATPVDKAAMCYGRGDMPCVLKLLRGAQPQAAQAAEHWRMLAMAAARLDQHRVARDAFGRWIQLDPRGHRLEKSTSAPVIYRDWAAAWLHVHRASLDMSPRRPPPPAPLPTAVTVGELPRFVPPPRSQRDAADDTVFSIGPVLGPLHRSDRSGWVGLHLGVERLVGESLCFGVAASVMGRGHAVTDADPRTGIGLLTGVVGARLGDKAPLTVMAQAGFAATPDSFVAGAAVRYDSRHLTGAAGAGARLYLQVAGLWATRPAFGRPLLTVSLGALIGGVKR